MSDAITWRAADAGLQRHRRPRSSGSAPHRRCLRRRGARRRKSRYGASYEDSSPARNRQRRLMPAHRGDVACTRRCEFGDAVRCRCRARHLLGLGVSTEEVSACLDAQRLRTPFKDVGRGAVRSLQRLVTRGRRSDGDARDGAAAVPRIRPTSARGEAVGDSCSRAEACATRVASARARRRIRRYTSSIELDAQCRYDLASFRADGIVHPSKASWTPGSSPGVTAAVWRARRACRT